MLIIREQQILCAERKRKLIRDLSLEIVNNHAALKIGCREIEFNRAEIDQLIGALLCFRMTGEFISRKLKLFQEG